MSNAPGESGSDEYLRGYSAGREAERERFRKLVHDDISGNLIAVSFALEAVRQQLEQEGRSEAQDLKRTGELVDLSIEALVKAFAAGHPIAGKE